MRIELDFAEGAGVKRVKAEDDEATCVAVFLCKQRHHFALLTAQQDSDEKYIKDLLIDFLSSRQGLAEGMHAGKHAGEAGREG